DDLPGDRDVPAQQDLRLRVYPAPRNRSFGSGFFMPARKPSLLPANPGFESLRFLLLYIGGATCVKLTKLRPVPARYPQEFKDGFHRARSSVSFMADP